MGLETATEIWQLNPAWPLDADPLVQGAAHIRMIKNSVQDSLPMNAPLDFDGVAKADDPVSGRDLVNLQYLQSNVQHSIGYPFLWFLDALPSADYGDLDGSAKSRAVYADLYAMYGVVYGAGDGVTTFNIPKASGLFLRIQDHGAGVDPNAATRTNRGDGVTGDKVGTKQADDIKLHKHNIVGNNNAGGGGTSNLGRMNNLGGSADWVTENQITTGGAETRPVNIYARLIMRLK